MNFNFPILREAGNLRGKRVFAAIDLNVPIREDKVVDDYRIKRNRITIDFLKNAGARILLVSHRTEETASLLPVFNYLKREYAIVFASTLSDARTAMETAPNGTFVMLENIRKVGGEKEKKNDPAFTKELASLADVFVNEAFSVSHREHASIVGVPKFLPSYAGFLFEEEVAELSKAFNPPKPFMFLLAGAKFETKFPLVKKFLGLADFVFIGGALANDLFKARGYETGFSNRSQEDFGFAEIARSSKLILPIDVVAESAGEKSVKKLDEVSSEDRILDAGPKTVEMLRERFKNAKFILWNGTLGAYESGFAEGTEMLARAIAESGVESIVGGGDTLACISKLNLLDKFSFVSTGGGAMLEFLANETLPGLEALTKTNKLK